jgi:hypothetical protein
MVWLAAYLACYWIIPAYHEAGERFG